MCRATILLRATRPRAGHRTEPLIFLTPAEGPRRHAVSNLPRRERLCILRQHRSRTSSLNATSAPASRSRRPRPRRLTSDDYQALGAFRRSVREFLAFSEAGARNLGLTPQQRQALLAVRAHPADQPITIGELAESLLIRNHSAIGLVTRIRDVSTVDRRRVVLYLTPLGEQKLETISRNNLAELSRTGDIIGDLVRTLRKLESEGALVASGENAALDTGPV